MYKICKMRGRRPTHHPALLCLHRGVNGRMKNIIILIDILLNQSINQTSIAPKSSADRF